MAKNNKNTAIIVVCGIFILLSVLCFMWQSDFLQGSFSGGKNEGTVMITSDDGDTEGVNVAGDDGSSQSSEKDEIAVYLCGAIRHPGVYKLPIGSRVCDAIKAAGGLKSTASLTAVNQAKLLSDGEQIEFPTKKQRKQVSSGSGGSDNKESETVVKTKPDNGASGLVNINNADLAELMTLSGIGESRANSIITYRTEHGLFTEVKDIMKVTGIKDGIYQKIKDNITV